MLGSAASAMKVWNPANDSFRVAQAEAGAVDFRPHAVTYDPHLRFLLTNPVN